MALARLERKPKRSKSEIKTGYEMAQYIQTELSEKYSKLYFNCEYKTEPWKVISLVFYNCDKNESQYDISCCGNIAILIEGFKDDDTIDATISAKLLKEREVRSIMNWKDKHGDVDKTVKYIIDKFRHLDLARITDVTR